MGDQERPDVERRTHQRVVLKTSVTFCSPTNFYTGFTGNISEGGIFVATYQPVEIGDEMAVEFSLPDDGPPIKTRGVVRWCREENPASDAGAPPGIGMQFTEVSEGDRRRIEHFVANRDTIFYDD